jgi:hypothetical protein
MSWVHGAAGIRSLAGLRAFAHLGAKRHRRHRHSAAAAAFTGNPLWTRAGALAAPMGRLPGDLAVPAAAQRPGRSLWAAAGLYHRLPLQVPWTRASRDAPPSRSGCGCAVMSGPRFAILAPSRLGRLCAFGPDAAARSLHTAGANIPDREIRPDLQGPAATGSGTFGSKEMDAGQAGA